MDTCTAEFERLATTVGGIECQDVGLVSVRSPFSLDNGTMPVIEVVLVAGAVAALVHAIRWQRRTGDSTNLVVWCAGILGLLLIEPFVYFPHWFGIEGVTGLPFIHNHFSVQFLFNRLPLYIVAMYPAYAYLAFVLVRRAGVFDRFRPVIGATCVAVTFFCFYEVVDLVGPQLGWWIWNYEAPPGLPRLGAVPFIDLTAFNLAIPFGIALLASLTGRRDWGLGRRVLVSSVGMLPFLTLGSMPTNILDWVGVPSDTARIVGTWAVIAVTFLVAGTAFARSTPRTDREPFVAMSAAVYLVVVAGIWAYALPDHLDARDGITAQGTYTSPLAFAAVSALGCLALVWVSHRRVRQPAPVREVVPA